MSAPLPRHVLDQLPGFLELPEEPTVDDVKVSMGEWLLAAHDVDVGQPEAVSLQSLQQVVIGAMHGDLDVLAELRIYSPLSLAVLWRNEELDLDQRRMFIRAAQARVSWEKGGNRAGKTHQALILDVCTAASSAHPMVRQFCLNNNIPLDILPDAPQDVVVVAESASLSIRDHRTPIHEMLPRDGIIWHGRNAKDECYVEIIVPGFDRPGRIWFKSLKQTHKAFKGGKAFRYHIDEEPNTREGRLVVEECYRGVSAVGGNISITATPQEGTTWLKEEFVDRPDGPMYGCVVMSLDSLGNRLVEDYQSLVDYFDSLDPDEARMRRYGDFVDRGGMVLADWKHGDLTREGQGHVCERFPIPKSWPRFRGADFGVGDPTFVVWAAREPKTGILYVYRCYEQSGKGAEGHVEPLHVLQGDKRVQIAEGVECWELAESYEGSWGDPSGKDWMEIWADHDLTFDPANRNRDTGAGAVIDRCRLVNGRPRIKVFHDLVPLLKSIENLAWDPNSKKPMWIKKNDHGWDALRYLCVGVLEGYES